MLIVGKQTSRKQKKIVMDGQLLCGNNIIHFE